MESRRGLVIGIVVIAIVGVLVAGWLRWRASEQPVEASGELQRLSFTEVPISSPGLAVSLQSVQSAMHPGHTSWSLTLVCDEPEGCAAELTATVDYRSGGDRRQIAFNTRCDVSDGGVIRFDGLEDPPSPVTRVDRVMLEVTSRAAPGAWPTPAED